MIGIIGYGMVGKALAEGFPNTEIKVFDPYEYPESSLLDLAETDAIFVCVPTPTDNDDYSVLIQTLVDIKQMNYKGITVVKSTVLPQFIQEFDVVYNPEFLSRSTSVQDFIYPEYLLFGGDPILCDKLYTLYKQYSIVCPKHVFSTDIQTASFVKYVMNTFFATKVTFMNQMYDVAKKIGADYNIATEILAHHPWMGTNHFKVPGPDGHRGFGGPCLPKETEALVKYFDVELLKKVLEINETYR